MIKIFFICVISFLSVGFSQINIFYFQKKDRVFEKKVDIVSVEQVFTETKVKFLLAYAIKLKQANNPAFIYSLSFNKKKNYILSSEKVEGLEIFIFEKELFFKNKKLFLQVKDTVQNKKYNYVFKKKKVKSKKGEIIRGH
ncbi:MAG: hypothetical protein V4622_09215 [Bacteroidota bacterium]